MPADKPIEREDRFESLVKRTLAFLDENRSVVAVSVVAALLISGAVFLKIRASRKLNEDAWTDLARMGGHTETTSKVREILKRYEGTDAEVYIRMSLARKLFEDARKDEVSSKKEDVEARIKNLSEAVDQLEKCLKEFGGHPAAPDAKTMYEKIKSELSWAREHGGSFDPKAPHRVWRKKTWTAAEAKQARKLDHLDDKPGLESQVTIETSKGPIILALYEDDAPNHAANFISLVQEGYLDGKEITEADGLLVAAGLPADQKSVYALKPEITVHKHEPGAVAMAVESGFESSGQRFHIMKSAAPDRDGKETVFARVIMGMDVVSKLVKGDKITAVWLDKKKMRDYYPLVRYLEEPAKPPAKAGGS